MLMLGGLLPTTVPRPSSPAGACAVFLVVYSITASCTEVGDASPCLLGFAVAASRLASGCGEAPVPVSPAQTPGTVP